MGRLCWGLNCFHLAISRDGLKRFNQINKEPSAANLFFSIFSDTTRSFPPHNQATSNNIHSFVSNPLHPAANALLESTKRIEFVSNVFETKHGQRSFAFFLSMFYAQLSRSVIIATHMVHSSLGSCSAIGLVWFNRGGNLPCKFIFIQ